MFTSSLPKTILRLLAVLVLLGLAAWYFWRYQEAQKQLDSLTNPTALQEQALEERQALLDAVAAHMTLPAGEQPLILDIENAAPLAAAQPFFRDAADGDKVLIYARAGISVLYSPSRDEVVNVGELNVETAPATESGEATPASQPAAQ